MQYPAGLDTLPHARNLFNMIVGRDPLNTPQALKSAWVVQGYIQGALVGEPVIVPASVDTVEPAIIAQSAQFGQATDAEAVEYLSQLCTNLDAEISGKIQPASIVSTELILRLLLPVIQTWMISWLQKGGLERLVHSFKRD